MTATTLAGWTISLDLWGTLINHTDKNAVAEWRVAEFVRVLEAFGHNRPPDQVRTAVTATDRAVLNRQRHKGVQPALDDMLTAILDPLDVPAAPEMMPVLRIVHTHAALRGCPQPIHGAVKALAALTATGARVVLTSNTLATTSAVHRQLLDDLDLAAYFDDMLFSEELGVAKPHPNVFATIAARAQSTPERICHVGDDPRTDVHGALATGCRAVHYRPTGRTARTEVPVITHLDQLVGTLTAICQAADASPVPVRS